MHCGPVSSLHQRVAIFSVAGLAIRPPAVAVRSTVPLQGIGSAAGLSAGRQGGEGGGRKAAISLVLSAADNFGKEMRRCSALCYLYGQPVEVGRSSVWSAKGVRVALSFWDSCRDVAQRATESSGAIIRLLGVVVRQTSVSGRGPRKVGATHTGHGNRATRAAGAASLAQAVRATVPIREGGGRVRHLSRGLMATAFAVSGATTGDRTAIAFGRRITASIATALDRGTGRQGIVRGPQNQTKAAGRTVIASSSSASCLLGRGRGGQGGV